MSKPILYAYSLSSCSWRVRIALAYKGIQHEIKPVNTLKQESRTEEYLAINPAGQIPVLEVDGTRIAESIAIMEYLEDKYPEHPIYPKEILQKAKVREICALIATGIQPLQNPKVAARHSDNPAKQTEWINYYLENGFQVLEKILSQTSTDEKYCFGNSLTAADCCFVPQVYNAVTRFKLDMTPYPKVLNIYNSLMELESVKLGHPDNKL